MKIVVWSLVVLLVILHQDNWFWDDGALLFGWAPVTLVYHAGISLAAAIVWFMATRFCWPTFDDAADPSSPSKDTQA